MCAGALSKTEVFLEIFCEKEMAIHQQNNPFLASSLCRVEVKNISNGCICKLDSIYALNHSLSRKSNIAQFFPLDMISLDSLIIVLWGAGKCL